MKISPLSCVSGFLWIASLVAAYWAGGHFTAPLAGEGDTTSPSIAITIDPRTAGPSSEGRDKGEGSDATDPEGTNFTGS